MVTLHPACKHKLREEVFIMRKNKIVKGTIETIHTTQINGKLDPSQPDSPKETLYEHRCQIAGGRVLNFFITKFIPEDKIYSSIDEIVCALVEEHKNSIII